MFQEEFVTNVMSDVKIKKTKKGFVLTLRYLIIINKRKMGNERQAEQIHVLKQTECKTHPELQMIKQEEIISHSGHKKSGNQTQIQRHIFIIKLYLVSTPEDLLYTNALWPVWSRLYRVLIYSGLVTR